MVLVGAALHITGWEMSRYIYCTGAVLFAAAQFSDTCPSDSPTVRRLRAQQILGGVFLLLAGVLMYAEGFRGRIMTDMTMNPSVRNLLMSLTRRNSWILALSIAAVFELYSSMRIDSELKKEQQEQDGDRQ